MKRINDLPLDEPEKFKFKGRKKKKRTTGWAVYQTGYWEFLRCKTDPKTTIMYVGKTKEDAENYLERRLRAHPWYAKDNWQYKIEYKE